MFIPCVQAHWLEEEEIDRTGGAGAWSGSGKLCLIPASKTSQPSLNWVRYEVLDLSCCVGRQAAIRMTLIDILCLDMIVARFELDPDMAIFERLDGLTGIII